MVESSVRNGTKRIIAVGLLGLFLGGCVFPFGGRFAPMGASRFSLTDVAEEGDAARRASMRLILSGLEEDQELRPAHALALYERALQVDPNNPFAYLALARHHVEGAEPQRALAFLEKADVLLANSEWQSPGLEADLVGIRGSALYASDRIDRALPLLERARRLVPAVWDDARLDARELR
jgi:tetratricopeptide (TPR) repeat protein